MEKDNDHYFNKFHKDAYEEIKGFVEYCEVKKCNVSVGTPEIMVITACLELYDSQNEEYNADVNNIYHRDIIEKSLFKKMLEELYSKNNDFEVIYMLKRVFDTNRAFFFRDQNGDIIRYRVNDIFCNECVNFSISTLNKLIPELSSSTPFHELELERLHQKKRNKPNMNKEFLEKNLERFLIYRGLQDIEEGMSFIDNQVEIENGFIDILARDRNGKLCIIELKITDSDKSLIFQSAYYPTQFDEEVRMITIAPNYSKKIELALRNMNNVELKTYSFSGRSGNYNVHIEDYVTEENENIEAC